MTINTILTQTLLKLPALKTHLLVSQVQPTSTTLNIEFGHYKVGKTTVPEIQTYLRYNRRLSIQSTQQAELQSKLHFIVTGVTRSNSPVVQNKFFKHIEGKHLDNFLNLTNLKTLFTKKQLVNGRVLKQVRGGFLIAVLGFTAFLPFSKTLAKRYFVGSGRVDLGRLQIIFNSLPLQVISMRYVKFKQRPHKVNVCVLKIIVSLAQPLKLLEAQHKKQTVKQLIQLQKLVSV